MSRPSGDQVARAARALFEHNMAFYEADPAEAEAAWRTDEGVRAFWDKQARVALGAAT